MAVPRGARCVGIGRHWDAGVVGELLQYLVFSFGSWGQALRLSHPVPYRRLFPECCLRKYRSVDLRLFPLAVWAAEHER